MKGFRNSEQIGRALDKYTEKEIVFRGLLTILILGIVIHLALMIPLNHKIQDELTSEASLQKTVGLLEEEANTSKELIPQGYQLPAALTALQDCFLANSLIIEEITISHSSADLSRNLSQAVIKAAVKGEREQVFKAINQITGLKTYPFIIEELDWRPTEAILYLKILLR